MWLFSIKHVDNVDKTDNVAGASDCPITSFIHFFVCLIRIRIYCNPHDNRNLLRI